MHVPQPCNPNPGLEVSCIPAILDQLTQEVQEYDLGREVSLVDGCPTPLEFFRHYVSRNRPCVFRNCISHWSALGKWDLDYITCKMGSAQATVTLTPDGKADAVVPSMEGPPCFALPYQQDMTFGEFRKLFCETRVSGQRCVPSVQFQNSNLTEHFTALQEDVDVELDWASAAFGCRPDAVNLWVGDARYHTSFHKDHYENMYCQVRGTKTFTLLPPSSVHRMHLQTYPVYQHELIPGSTGPVFRLVRQQPEALIQWCPIDMAACRTNADEYPRFSQGPKPITVTLRPGEVLYLPSLWYHYVEQDEQGDDAVISVNYWYDMTFDSKFAYFNAIEALSAQAGLISAAPIGSSTV